MRKIPFATLASNQSTGKVANYDIELPNTSGYVWKIIGAVGQVKFSGAGDNPTLFNMRLTLSELSTDVGGLDLGPSHHPASLLTMSLSTVDFGINKGSKTSTVQDASAQTIEDKYARGGVKLSLIQTPYATLSWVGITTTGYILVEEVKLTSTVQAALLAQGNSYSSSWLELTSET